MPEKDLGTLLYDGCGGDRTVAADEPAESFRVRIERWIDRVPVYDREDSTKGNTNPKSTNHLSKPSSNSSSSQRFSTNLKATTNIHRHSRYSRHSVRRQPKRRAAVAGQPRGRKSELVLEPASPKVSCFGRVLPEAKPDHRQRFPTNNKQKDEPIGCWAAFMAVFRFRRNSKRQTRTKNSLDPSRNIPAKRNIPVMEEPLGSAPELGKMKKFVSGRRAALWGEGWEMEEGDGAVAWSAPLEREEVWARRSVGSLYDAQRDDCGWESEGSASV